MRLRVLLPLIALLGLTGAGLAAGPGRSAGADDAVVVGSVRVPATSLAGAPGSRAAAADRAIERLWLEGEASARGLRPERDIADLRGQIADALAGPGPVPEARRFAAAFEAFHRRWRARTRCMPEYRDPYEDRCGDGIAAAAGSCRWMGEATLCNVRRGWLVVSSARAGGAAAARLPRRLAAKLESRADRDALRAVTIRVRARDDAVALVRAIYAVARGARARAAAAERAAAAARAQEERVARAARELERRRHDPRLSAAALGAARDACAQQLRASEPYMFGFGMQDVVGQAEGLIAARRELIARLRRASDDVTDRGKLGPLVAAVGAGNAELLRLAAAGAVRGGDLIAARVARLDERTETERAVSRRLGLGDCLARPAA